MHTTNGLLYSVTVDVSSQLDVECHYMISNAYLKKKITCLEIDPKLKMIEKLKGFLTVNSSRLSQVGSKTPKNQKSSLKKFKSNFSTIVLFIYKKKCTQGWEIGRGFKV